MRFVGAQVAAATDLLAREAYALDRKDWDAWLALYTADAVFWVPAWRGPNELTTSPDSELSWIHAASRSELEERVWRIRSGLSIASSPLPRTVHTVSNIVAEATSTGIDTFSAGSVLVFDASRGKRDVHYCRYEHALRAVDGNLQIARKHVALADDRVATMLDFYCL